ncbi:MAG TPA: YceH family protein [Verrucomicrobiales bacterium]|nr:YceH family protein [Verrucomicrobiales bacterium]
MSDEHPPHELETAPSGGKPAPLLTFEESRVLGCLLEKEATTPDQYPLTFNALYSACNQSSNREPVTDFGTDTVEEAMEGLRYKKLSILVHQAGARVPKCKHTLENKFPYLTKGQTALLCVLLLRGQQTVGELRQRTERLHPFADIERVQTVLDEMADYSPEPLVKLIPAGGGRRAATYVHLLCGDVAPMPVTSGSSRGESAGIPASSWRAEMEEEITSLKADVLALRSEIEALKSNLGV